MTGTDVLADLDRALAATEAVVSGIRADQWAAPTPCTELADHLGGDPLAAFQRAGRELREAFSADGILRGLPASRAGFSRGRA